jgi:glutamine amidotransferase
MRVTIIKYNAGNIMSVDYALRRFGVEAEITEDHDRIRTADKVIFPGVGEASTTMQYLKSRGLDHLIAGLKQPVLGICLGLQLMCTRSEEGDTACLGIFKEKVIRFKTRYNPGDHFKVPHMGWNTVTGLTGPLFKDINENEFFYFVHSFYAAAGEETTATCYYPDAFSAALQRNNFFATQFHPEKSGKPGAIILKNFIEL